MNVAGRPFLLPDESKDLLTTGRADRVEHMVHTVSLDQTKLSVKCNATAACLPALQSFSPDGEVLDTVDVDADAQSGRRRHVDHAVAIHGPLRRHDVSLPIPRARTEVARKAEVRQGRQRHVIRPPYSALQHAAAP